MTAVVPHQVAVGIDAIRIGRVEPVAAGVDVCGASG